MFGTPVRIDLPLEMFFAVEIEGEIDTGFRRVSGLNLDSEEFEIHEVNNLHVVKRPVSAIHKPVTLTKGYTYSDSLWDWYMECINYQKGKPDYRRSSSIVQLYPIKKVLVEIRRWNLFNSRIKRYKTASFDSDSRRDSIQELSIEYDGLPVRPYDFGSLGRIIDLLT